jgi:glucose/arabinose dehydrogenase
VKYIVNRICVVLATCLLPALVWALEDIELPPGFAIEEYAAVPNARSLALGDNGTVFVSTRRGRSVYAVVAEGEGTRTIELLDGLNTPNGIAFHDGDLYVAETTRVTRYRNIEANLQDVPDAEILDIELPSKRHHGWRYIGFGPDEKLYISIGAPCNVCDEDGFGRIIRMNADGSGRETYAEGIRNSVGFTWHPETGDLWFTDNGRDMLGDDLPPDELNNAARRGQHFGFPYCHAGELLDPKFGSGKDCADYSGPAQKLGPHVAPLGVKFYTGSMFPTEYNGQVFIAEHGSWNRSKKIGYRLTLVRLEDGVPVSYEPFATGWLQGESVSGRPVDLLVLPDGSMLVSDDHAEKIYRISYTASEN